MTKIANKYDDFKCVECADEMKNFLNAKGVKHQQVEIQFGAATGATLALGGAAGLAATGTTIAGYSLSVGASFAISVGAMAVASMASYSLDCAFSKENKWNAGIFFLAGAQGAF